MIGNLPGFLLPVIIVQRLSVDAGSAILLCISTAMIVTSVFAASVEASSLALLSSTYADGENVTRWQLHGLARHALRLLTVPALATYVVLLVILWRLSSDLAFERLALISVFVAPTSVILIWTASFTGELFARRRLHLAYVSGFARVVAVIAAVLSPTVVLVAVAYLIGEVLRGAIVWRAATRELDIGGKTGLSFSFREVALLFVSNALGQVVPSMMQAMFAVSGPVAISQGAIALRIHAAVGQLTTSGVTMHNVARFAEFTFGAPVGTKRRVIAKEALNVAVGAICIALPVFVAAVVATAVMRDYVSAIVIGGVQWSLVAIAAMPLVALTFWAGRGLIIVKLSRPLPVTIAVASIIGLCIGWALLPSLGGIAALVSSAVCSLLTAIGYVGVLLLYGDRGIEARNMSTSQ